MIQTRSQGPPLADDCEDNFRRMHTVSDEFQGMSSNQKHFAFFAKKGYERSLTEKCHRMSCDDERLNVSGHVSDYCNRDFDSFSQISNHTWLESGIQIPNHTRLESGIQIPDHTRLESGIQIPNHTQLESSGIQINNFDSGSLSQIPNRSKPGIQMPSRLDPGYKLIINVTLAHSKILLRQLLIRFVHAIMEVLFIPCYLWRALSHDLLCFRMICYLVNGKRTLRENPHAIKRKSMI